MDRNRNRISMWRTLVFPNRKQLYISRGLSYPLIPTPTKFGLLIDYGPSQQSKSPNPIPEIELRRGFSRWQPRRRNSRPTSSFELDDVIVFCKPNFDDIPTSPYWNSTSGFHFDHIKVYGIYFCMNLPILSKSGHP